MSADRGADLVIVGDGPAGSALAAACMARDVDVLLAGADASWSATYAGWVDDLAGIIQADAVFAAVFDSVAVHTDRYRELARPYGIFDNMRLRDHLRAGVPHLTGRVVEVAAARSGRRCVRLADGSTVETRLVVDAGGWPSAFVPTGRRKEPAWQTALGIVLEEPPPGDLGQPTWMDFRPVGTGDRRSTIGPTGVTTFCYSLPVSDGWLVEETVLAARPAVEPLALLRRLATRVGRHPDELLADAVRTEYVRIPMGAAVTAAGPDALAFGSAAGYVHPATGFSVTASMRAAPRVADALADALTSPRSSGPTPLAEAVWPRSQRRTRVLHDYGLDTLLRLDGDEVRGFFGAFFDLPVADWSAYLRLDTPPGDIARVMTQLFRSMPWTLRRRLMAANPVALTRLARP